MKAGLIAISPQMEKYNDTIVKQKKLTFTIVSDAHNNIAEQLGIKFTLAEQLQGIYDGFKINLPRYINNDFTGVLFVVRMFVITQLCRNVPLF